MSRPQSAAPSRGGQSRAPTNANSAADASGIDADDIQLEVAYNDDGSQKNVAHPQADEEEYDSEGEYDDEDDEGFQDAPGDAQQR